MKRPGRLTQVWLVACGGDRCSKFELMDYVTHDAARTHLYNAGWRQDAKSRWMCPQCLGAKK